MRTKRVALALIMGLLWVNGCDDSHETNELCDKDCGHGICIGGTMDRCSCNDGYSTDASGSCTVADPATLVLSAKPTSVNGQAEFQVRLIDVGETIKNPKIKVTRRGAKIVEKDGNLVSVKDAIGTTNKAGYLVTVESSNNAEIEPLYVPVWNESEAFDWRDALIYFTFTDRFNNGNPANDKPLNIDYDWMGGDFAGITAKIEEGYFDKLGVNTIWLSSISMNTQSVVDADGFTMSGYHSYWPITTGYTDKTASLFEGATSNGVAVTPVEPHFGTLDEFITLVDAAHSHNIRILIDFAANHVSDESPIYKLHPEWFNGEAEMCTGNDGGNWNRIPETCWFAYNLPDFNYDVAEARKFVLDHAKWLIETTDIDGFRLDAVKHMRQSFIKELRTAVDSIMAGSGQTFYIVGETFDSYDTIKKYLGDDQLHGQFDFPLYNKIRDTIFRAPDNKPEGGSEYYQLKDFVLWNDTAYDGSIMSTFLGNQDVARAISYIKRDNDQKYGNNSEVGPEDSWAYNRLRAGWAFLLTSPMIPLIYYGDEYGLEGANDPDNRKMMEFGDVLNSQQKETLALVQKLGQIRKEHKALTRGKRQNIDASERAWLYMMKDESETLLIGFSDFYDGNSWTFDVPSADGAGGWTDLLNPENEITDTTRVELNEHRRIIVWKKK